MKYKQFKAQLVMAMILALCQSVFASITDDTSPLLADTNLDTLSNNGETAVQMGSV